VRGQELNVTRVLEARGDCEAVVRTAALIVDRALDEFTHRGEAPRIDRLAPLPFEVAVAVGASVEQGDLGLSGEPELELRFTRGSLVWGLTGDFRPPALTAPKDMGQIRLLGGSVEATLGFAPRLGPGRLALEAAGGLNLTTGSFELAKNSPEPLFQFQTQHAATSFAALRLGYTLNLPRHLFLTARVEERFSPQTASFDVDGATNGPQATTRHWTLLGTLAFGWRFQ
jgi:hypothetical protein